MIYKYISDLSAKIGVIVPQVSFVDGRTFGSLDVHLLHLANGRRKVSTLVLESDLDELQRSGQCDKLELKIREALVKLVERSMTNAGGICNV